MGAEQVNGAEPAEVENGARFWTKEQVRTCAVNLGVCIFRLSVVGHSPRGCPVVTPRLFAGAEPCVSLF